MNLQTWAKWVAEIDATTGGAAIDLRPEAYGGMKICVRWMLGKEQYRYEHALSMTEMRGMYEVVQPCVLEQIANAVRKMMHSAALTGAEGVRVEGTVSARETKEGQYGDCCREDLEVVRRKIFVCIHCDMIYPDQPVTQCDCLEGTGHDFVEGVAEYQKPTANVLE